MRFFVRPLGKFILFLLLLGVSLVAGLWYYSVYYLPDIEALNTVQFQVPLQIYSRDGKRIAEYGQKRRIPVEYNKIPHLLVQAVLATEDQHYFKHPGVDLSGLVRAAILLATTGKKVQGGSTITMQVARGFYLNRHKTYIRKIQEILLALKIDSKLSKQKILELYLNKIFLGSRAYGVAAAAEVYYGKKLNDLTLDEIAMLAGLPQAPSALNPINHPEAAIKRRNHVLNRMYTLGYIDKNQFEQAILAPLDVHYHEWKAEVKAPWFAEFVRQQLEEMYGDIIYTKGFKVTTTLDSFLQKTANVSVRDGLLAYDQRHGYRGPEKYLAAPSFKNMRKFEKMLAEIPVINGLEPAVVIDQDEKSITVLRANGKLAVIKWDGLSWARPVNKDGSSYQAPLPERSSDIVELGDLVRIFKGSDNKIRLGQLPEAQAGFISLDPRNGAILAMVGGFDFQKSNFNRVTHALRQPGSSFKPFIYSAALENGYTLASLINDAPVVYQNSDNDSFWRPRNDERRFFGPTRLRDALIHSRNLVSVRLLQQIRVPTAVSYAKRFGFSDQQLPKDLTLALGTASVTPLQMASAYCVFANGGFKVMPYAVNNVFDSQGVVQYQANPLRACENCEMDIPDNTRAPRVVKAENAFLITSVLHDVIQHGTARRAKKLKRRDLSGKTGTTQNQVDAWFVGYSPDIVALTWVGFDKPRSLHEFASRAALPIWVNFMRKALEKNEDNLPIQPAGIVSIRIDPLTGKRAQADNPVARFEYFMRPWLPEQESTDAATAESEAGLY